MVDVYIDGEFHIKLKKAMNDVANLELSFVVSGQTIHTWPIELRNEDQFKLAPLKVKVGVALSTA